MNREIKFRVWQKSRERMLDWGDLSCWSFNSVQAIYLFDESARDSFIMQYTGLKDKNGKEIYDGDIVSYGAYKQEVKIEEHEDDDGALVYGYGFASPDTNSLEIIGNIYENKELLK